MKTPSELGIPKHPVERPTNCSAWVWPSMSQVGWKKCW